MPDFRTAPPPHTGLGWLDYAMVVGYLLLTMAIVIVANRRQKDTIDYFLAGRRMPWFAVGLSIMATLLSTMTYLGVPGEMIKHGIAIFSMYIAFPLSMLVVIPLFIPFFMRLKMTSAYEYLESRFDYRARFLASILFFCLRLGWMSMVLFTGSLAMAAMTDFDLLHVIAVLGLVATIYTFFGGLEAVIWTDVLQAFMLIGGAILIIGYVWITTGASPVDWWRAAATQTAGHTRPILFSLDPSVRMTLGTVIINGFFWQICTHASDQVVLQRYFATTSLASARNSYIVNMVSSFSIGVLLGLAGFALLFFYLKHPTYLPAGMSPTAGDKVMPYFYAHQLPWGLGGLVLANFLCDAMQTLVSGVNSISAVASQDFFRRKEKSEHSERQKLRFARFLTLIIGLISTAVALTIAYSNTAPNSSGKGPEMAKNIVDLMPRTFNLFLGPLGSLFLIGMFVPRARTRTLLVSVGVSLAAAICYGYAGEFFGLRTAEGKTLLLSPNWAIAMPCLLSFALAQALSLLEPNGDHPGRRFTWREVMCKSP